MTMCKQVNAVDVLRGDVFLDWDSCDGEDHEPEYGHRYVATVVTRNDDGSKTVTWTRPDGRTTTNTYKSPATRDPMHIAPHEVVITEDPDLLGAA